MSINNLFNNNDFHIKCKTLTCDNLIPGSIESSNAVYRLNIDPTSNPDPNINGLIVTAATTATYNYALPLSSNQNFLGIANSISHDPNNHLSFDGTTITCNKSGNYSFSIQLAVLGNLITPGNICIAQVIPVAQTIFGGPPGVSVGGSFLSMISTPVSEIFNIASLIASSSIVHLEIGDQVQLKFYLAYDTCVISLTSCLTIIEL